MDARDAHAKLIEALRVVRDQQLSGADDWEFSLLRTVWKYFEAIGVDKELLLPVWKMHADKWTELTNARRREAGETGTPKKPLATELVMVFAAAAVTVLKKQKGSVEKALVSVARDAGIARKALKSFRDNINRGMVSADAIRAYEQYVVELQDWPPKEIAKKLATLRGFVS